MKKIDRTGNRYGNFVVLKNSHSKKSNGRSRNYWLCKCDCGNEFTLASDSMNTTKSCGCIQKESTRNINLSHGETSGRTATTEYRTWTSLKSRCNNKNDHKYPIYGARGIKVCDRWMVSFENFIEDMGRKPLDKISIDRIDVNGNYEPSNCRWATSKQQANNKTDNVFITINNETMTMKEWSEKLGLKYKWVHAQLKYKGKTLQGIIDGRLSISN